MQILICPGIHSPQLTEQFVAAVPELGEALVYPAAQQTAYAGWEILSFLLDQLIHPVAQTPLLLIGFSAGVVGAVTLADLWQGQGGRVVALLAVDGWGVPLWRSFPVHRISHDPFTHWSSALLGAGKASFYADPAVGHLDLWRSPQTVQGWGQWNGNIYDSGTHGSEPYSPGTAAQFISHWLQRYCA